MVTENSNLTVQIPDQKQIERIIADKVEELWLAGFLNDNKGKGQRFNFILSNGDRSCQKSDQTMTQYMIPFDGRRIKRVQTYYNSNCI